MEAKGWTFKGWINYEGLKSFGITRQFFETRLRERHEPHRHWWAFIWWTLESIADTSHDPGHLIDKAVQRLLDHNPGECGTWQELFEALPGDVRKRATTRRPSECPARKVIEPPPPTPHQDMTKAEKTAKVLELRAMGLLWSQVAACLCMSESHAKNLALDTPGSGYHDRRQKQAEEIIRLRNSKLTWPQVSERTGISVRQCQRLAQDQVTYRPKGKQKAKHLADVIRLRDEGLTFKEIGERLGINPIYANQMFLRAGGEKTIKRRNATPEDKAEGIKLLEEGLSAKEVGRRLGFHHGTVLLW